MNKELQDKLDQARKFGGEYLIQELLLEIADLQAHKSLLALDKQSRVDVVLTPQIKAAIEEINAEYLTLEIHADTQIEELLAIVKKEVIAEGKSVKGQHLQAVYVKGRVTWDSKKLDGMMVLMPALAEARKEGEPTVTIRKVG